MQDLKTSKFGQLRGWHIIIPTKIIDDNIYEKKVCEYTHEEEDTMNISTKVEMVFTSAFAEKEYKRVNNCKSS